MSVNLGRVAYVEKGAFNSGTTYQKKDVVSFNGGSYVFIGDAPAANVPPTDEANWQPLIDPTAMNNKIAEVDSAKETALTAAENAHAKAQEAMEAASTATVAAAAADEARTNIQSDLAQKAPAIYVDASGDMVHITDGAAQPVRALITHIAPKQDGSGWETLTLTKTGRNLIPKSEFVNRNYNGVTLNTQPDGSITASGAFIGSTVIDAPLLNARKEPFPAGTYRVTGCPPGGGTYSYRLFVHLTKADGTQSYFSDMGDGVTITFSAGDTFNLTIRLGQEFPAGETLVFRPQLEVGSVSMPYEPYNAKVLTASLPEEVKNGTYDWLEGVLTKEDGSTVQLMSNKLELAYGTNNIRSDAGDTEVNYVTDTKLYIDKKIAVFAASAMNNAVNILQAEQGDLQCEELL